MFEQQLGALVNPQNAALVLCGVCILIGALVASLYWYLFGNIFMKCYFKNVRSRGKYLMGVLVEKDASKYYHVGIERFDVDLIKDKYKRDDDKIKMVRVGFATVPFAVADRDKNLLISLTETETIVDNNGRVVTVPSDALTTAARLHIEHKAKENRDKMLQMLFLICLGLGAMILINLFLTYLAMDAASHASKASDYVAQVVSNLSYYARG